VALAETQRPERPDNNKCIPDAPLSEWTQFEEYELLSDCKAGQEKAADHTRENIERAQKSLQEAFKDFGPPSKQEKLRDDEEIQCALYARCVATDDPRLAK
jgi:hypothetical protein